MRRRQAANRRAGAFAVLAALAFAVLLTGPVAAQEKTDVGAVKASVALLLDNQKRCTRLADGQLELLEGPATITDRETSIDNYLYRKARSDVDAARRSLDIVYRLTSTFGIEVSDAGYTAIAEMLNAQEELYGLAGYSSHWRSALEYKQLTLNEASKFQAAYRSLPRQFVPNSSESRAALRRYEAEIFESSSTESPGSGSGISGGPPGKPVESRAYTAKEYARRKDEYNDWLKEQERRQRELRQRQAAQRERRKERQEAMSERDMPKLTRQVCTDLARAVGTYMKDEAVTSPPDEIVAEVLGTAFREFKHTADACIAGRLQKAKVHMSAGRKALGQASEALKAYSLGL